MIKSFNTIGEMDSYINPLIHGDFSGDDMLVLADYVNKLKPGDSYLEVGVKRGKSAACAVFSAEEGVRMFFCDIEDWGGTPAPNFSLSRKDWFETQRLDEKSIFILGDSAKVAKNWPAEVQLSLIFIDADHFYGAVKKDIEGWTPHLKSGGVMLFHDYGTGGVDKAVDELIRYSDKWTDFFNSMEKYDIHSSSIVGATKK